MSLTAIAVEKRVVTYFAAFLLVVGGIASFFTLGQLEDPAFTVKTAVIITPYPGGSPEEVELEVTDRIEIALQELSQLDYLYSFSRAGLSFIEVNIKTEFWSDRLPQIWDEMRRKIRDIEVELPPGAGSPQIFDDYGDVFGFQLAITGDGYTYAELEDFAKGLRKELNLVEGVARVDLWGIQQKVVYVDISEAQASQLGLSEESVASTLRAQNLVVDAGSLDLQNRRMRIAPSGQFQSISDIGDLAIRPTIQDTIRAGNSVDGISAASELIRVRDIATVRLGYQEPPAQLMRFNGESAIGLSITNVAGANIVDVGRAIDQRIEEMIPLVPIGLDINKVHWQSDIVAEAVDGFLINFAQAVGIVLVVLTLFMGWRMSLIIGSALILTILGSFILMALFKIDLQRMSLGALVIALGMMVDNAIVVADGITTRMQRGMDRVEAAVEGATQPAWPLLGATIVAVMAFYPIFSSTENVGEYCRTLFTVVAISLLVSWVVSVTVTPLQCIDMLPMPKAGGGTDPYGSRFYMAFRRVLGSAIRVRWLTALTMVGVLAVSVFGFGQVRQLFFPDSSMPKFMVDYWAPEGTRIQSVARDLKLAEAHIESHELVKDVATYVGSGAPRFYLPVSPEKPNPSYAQLIVNLHDFRDVPTVAAELDDWFKEAMPQALVVLQPFGVGPSEIWKFEVRISGPAVADPNVLRSLAGEVIEILENEPRAAYARTEWRQRIHKVVPRYNQERGRWATITRDDIARTTKRAFDGRTIGLYREGDDLIPITLRNVEEEREQVGGMGTLQISPVFSTTTIPLSQVVDGIEPEWEDPMIWRRDRRRMITVQANPVPGTTLPELRGAIIDQVEAIDLPSGYTMEWGGETESSADAQASLVPGMIPAAAVMVFLMVTLFNALRPSIIIICTIPFALIGITAGLLAFDVPFGFMALLGAMSLAGMMIKNAIVLLDQIDLELTAGGSSYEAVMNAAMSRLRPVVLAAATTVLGVIPLLQDVFWVAMAVTIMAGLTFGTVLTMILVPVFYAIFYKVPSPASA